MPHNNLSDALLRLSVAKLSNEKERDDLRTCLSHLASLADTDYRPNSKEKELLGFEPDLLKKLDELAPK